MLAGGIPLALLPVWFHSRLWVVCIVYVATTIFLLGLDAMLSKPDHEILLEVLAPKLMFIGERHIAGLSLRLPERASQLDSLLDVDESLTPPGLIHVEGTPGEVTRLSIVLAPRRRGTACLRNLWMRWSGPLGLMQRQTRHALEKKIPIVPNTKAVRTAALRFFTNRDFLSGIKVELYTGEGSEFESLRDFVAGMDHRAMHWKASARHRALLCREFRAERNHQVIMAIDTGYIMGEPIDSVPRVDWAINAALMLAYVSLRIGDRVGLLGFDSQVRCYCQPQGGLSSFQHLQLASSTLEYSSSETNYTLGMAELTARLRRRSLIIVLTDFVDTVSAELMIESLQRLSRHHLVLFVSLHNPETMDIASMRPSSLMDVSRSVVASDFLREHELVVRRLAQLGIHTVGAEPRELSAALINSYLEIKRRELIA